MKKKRIVLLHAHGQAGPKGRRSYMKFGTFKSKYEAKKMADKKGIDRARYVPEGKLLKTKHPLLFSIKK